jgi:hypothetical protein
MVVQTAKNRSAFNAPNRLNDPPDRCVFAKGQVRARRVVVYHLARQHMTQVPLSEDDDVAKALPTDRANQRSA